MRSVRHYPPDCCSHRMAMAVDDSGSSEDKLWVPVTSGSGPWSLSTWPAFLSEDQKEQMRKALSIYTYEDYIKDFELDYLGFDGIPDEPTADLCSVEIRDISSSDGRKESSKINEIQTHKP